MEKYKQILLCFLISIVISISTINAGAESAPVFPGNVNIIDREAFYGAQSISNVVLSDKVTEIRTRGIANSSLSMINLPKSINYIAEDAFDDPDKVLISAAAGTYAYNWAAQRNYNVSMLINWADKISIPTASEITSYNKTTYDKGWDGRSPYIGAQYYTPSEGFTEYAVDFRTNHQPS